MPTSEDLGIPNGINEFRADSLLILCTAVEWRRIREAFVTLREARRLTQADVAAEGRLPQSAISKLESNHNLGPSVEIFARAVQGLGVTLPQFFSFVEGLTHPVTTAQDNSSPSQSTTLAGGLRNVGSPVSVVGAADVDLVRRFEQGVATIDRIVSDLTALNHAVAQHGAAIVAAPPPERRDPHRTASTGESRHPRDVRRGSRRKSG